MAQPCEVQGKASSGEEEETSDEVLGLTLEELKDAYQRTREKARKEAKMWEKSNGRILSVE